MQLFFFTGLLIDNLGRRSTFILISCLFGAGYFVISFSVNLAMLISGRILVGICAGVLIITVPIYIAELSPPVVRGFLTALSQVSLTFGVLYSFAFGYFLSWAHLAMACAGWPMLMALTMNFMPESPSWLLKKNRQKSALDALKLIRPYQYRTDHECHELCMDIKRQEAIGGFSLRQIKEPTVYKPLLISVFLMVAAQLTGISAIIFNVVFVFKASGSSVDPRLCTIIFGLIQFVATSVVTFLIERFGRRPVLLVSCVGMFLSHVALGIYYLVIHLKGPEIREKLGWLPLVCLVVYMLFFVGFGLGPWVIIPEISPFRVRGFISSVANVAQWIFVFITTKEFSHMLQFMERFGTHFFYAGCILCTFIIVFMFLPETKGLSFKEIEHMFQNELATFLVHKPNIYPNNAVCTQFK